MHIQMVKVAEMDDLDRIARDVAISILQAEAEVPESQTPANVKLAREILAQLRQTETSQTEMPFASDLA
jgi:hypothetical protein